MKRTWLKKWLVILVFAAFMVNVVPAALAQTDPKPFDPNKNKPQEWMNLPEIIPFANPDGSIDIAWSDHSAAPPKIYLTRFVKNADGYARSSAEELPSLGVLAGFTKDEKGNVYHLTAELGKGEDPKRIVLYKNKQLFWEMKTQDGDGPPQSPKLPCDSGTSQIVTGAGKLFVDINLLPAHAYNVILDLENPRANAQRYARETLWHHNFDQRVLFDGKDFIAIENRDHEVTLSMMKFSPTESYPFSPYAERLRSVYTRTNNGNSTFTELGDIAVGAGDGNGYLVLFASERDWDDQMAGLNKPGEQTGLNGHILPRDLAVIHVRKDFDRQEINWKSIEAEREKDGNSISQAPKLVDTTSVVNSVGTGKIVSYKAENDGWDWPNYNADTAKLIKSGDLAERAYKTGGVNWLTAYGDRFETAKRLPPVGKPFTTVANPKLVRVAPNNYVAIWEEQSGTRIDGQPLTVAKTYQTTKAMGLTLEMQGSRVQITKSPINDLGKIRLMPFDDAFDLGGKAAFVTGDEASKSLKLHVIDADLNYKAVTLPLTGDLKSAASKPVPPEPKTSPSSDVKPAPATGFDFFELDGVGVKFARNWTNTRDRQARVISSTSPDKSVSLFLKGTEFTSYDPVQEAIFDILEPLFPGLEALEEVNTEHDIFKGGLGLRLVTYTAAYKGDPVRISVEFAKDTSDDAAPTVLLIRCVKEGDQKFESVISEVSQSLTKTNRRGK